MISDFQTVVGTGTPLAVGSTLSEIDRFATETEFNGAVIGVRGERCCGAFTWEGGIRLAIGESSSRAAISGETTATAPDGSGGTIVDESDFGLLTQDTNIGNYRRSDFTVSPELRLGLSWDLAPCWRGTLGYTLLYVGQVARVGDTIDRQVNLTQVGTGGLDGVPEPRFEWRLTDLVAHGFNVGLEATF